MQFSLWRDCEIAGSFTNQNVQVNTEFDPQSERTDAHSLTYT